MLREIIPQLTKLFSYQRQAVEEYFLAMISQIISKGLLGPVDVLKEQVTNDLTSMTVFEVMICPLAL